MAFPDALAAGDLAARAHLGGSVIYTPGTGAAVTVNGVFDQAYQLIDDERPGLSSSSPGVFLGLSDLPSDPSADTAATVTVGSTQYVIRESKPDGQGGVLLLLRRA